MKILHLTGVSNIPNEKGQEKIAKANGKKTENKDGGMPKSWYLENSLRPPPDAEDDEVEIDEYGQILLEPDDVDEIGIEVAIPLHLFAGVEENTDGTSTVYTTYQYQFTVFESSEDITNYIEYLTSPWHVKQIASIKVWWFHFKRRLKGIKKVNLEEILSRPENQPDYIAEK